MTARSTLAALRERTVDLRGLGEIRLLALEDGPARGQRLLFCRNAEGLECEIALDRGGDIPALRWRGVNLGWNGPVGAAPPASPDSEDGFGLLRALDGFLVTCGLDHYGMPASGSAEAFIYPRRSQLRWPMHGRVSGIAATLRSYGLDTKAEEPFLWCEAEVRQTALFGEVLVLHRRIEMPLFGMRINLHDRVLNAGFRPTSHAMLYHCNVGYPLLDETTSLSGDLVPSVLAAYTRQPPVPAPDTRERFDVQASIAATGHDLSAVEVCNVGLRGGVTLRISYTTSTLPQLGMWQAWQSGIYALGIEPHSELPSILQAAESREYKLQFEIRT